MTTLTPEDRARLRDLAGKATPGPWEAEWIEADSWWSITGAPYEEYVCPEVATVESGGGDEARYIAAADPATVTALLHALDASEADLQDLRTSLVDWKDAWREERARAERAEAEVERLHSWAGLMELLDEHWPESIFPTLPDNTERDTGPRIVSLIRRVDAAEAAVERVREKAQKWIDEYYEPVYRDNGWAQGVVSAATEVIRTLDGDA